MSELFDKIPGLKEAIENEQLSRTASFLDLSERVAGFELPPFTLTHMLKLYCIGSPFVCGGPITRLDVRQFLLVVSGARGLDRMLMRLKFMRLDHAKAANEIEGYVEEAFSDSPPSSGVESQSYYSFAASLVDFFAAEYGWNESETLCAPLKRLFQYVAAIRKRHNPGTVMFNPSDKVRSRWLMEQNRN